MHSSAYSLCIVIFYGKHYDNQLNVCSSDGEFGDSKLPIIYYYLLFYLFSFFWNRIIDIKLRIEMESIMCYTHDDVADFGVLVCVCVYLYARDIFVIFFFLCMFVGGIWHFQFKIKRMCS